MSNELETTLVYRLVLDVVFKFVVKLLNWLKEIWLPRVETAGTGGQFQTMSNIPHGKQTWA